MSDSRDLAHVEPAAAPVRQSDNLLAQVIAAAKDPTVDAAKMETLARLVNSQQDREREIEFNRSKNAAIMEMPVITKEGRIIIPANRDKGTPERQQGRFARWEDIDRVIRPILARYNLALSFDTAERQGGGLTVTPILSHTNGYTERGGAFPVPPETSGSKNAAQAMGSSLSYGKRYAGCAMLNIVTEGVDDDANMGRGTSVTLPFEREQLVRQEAEEAFNAGRYLAYFTEQSPKDRAWLVSSGLHEQYGGQPMIEQRRLEPGPEPKLQNTNQTEGEIRAEQLAGDARVAANKRTPVQMVEDFEKRLDGVETSKGIIDLQAEPKIAQWLSNLEDRFPELWRRVTDYAAKRYSTLVAGERERARSGGQDNGGPLL